VELVGVRREERSTSECFSLAAVLHTVTITTGVASQNGFYGMEA
jgi:hypothetical protein